MLRFECIQKLEKAKELWESLTPKKTIYDEWEFRFTFYKYYQPELFFYAGYLQNELIGVLPLQKEKEHDFLDFFGGDYMEDNRVLIRVGKEKYIPEFYDYIKSSGKKYKLEYITGEDEFTKNLPIIDYKYILPLHTFKSSADFIQQYFHGETKKKLTKRLRKVEENNIEIEVNQFEDVELMFQFNIETFKDREIHSMFSRKYRQDIFRDFLTQKVFTPRMLTFNVAGQKQAVSMALLYQDNYASLNTGIVQNALFNLNSYIHVKKIDDALNVNAKIFDAFVRSYGWKEQWHFQKIPQYTFLKP